MLLTKPLLQLSEVRCVTFVVDACKYATKPSDSLYSVCAPHTLPHTPHTLPHTPHTLPHTMCPHTCTCVYYMCVIILLVYVTYVCMSSDALYTCVAYYMCPHTTTTYVCTSEPVCVCACVRVCVRGCVCERARVRVRVCVCVRAREREWNDRCAASVRDNFFSCPPYCCGSRP